MSTSITGNTQSIQSGKNPQVPKPQASWGTRAVEWLKDHPGVVVAAIIVVAALSFAGAPFTALALGAIAFPFAVKLAVGGAIAGVFIGVTWGSVFVASLSKKEKPAHKPETPDQSTQEKNSASNSGNIGDDEKPSVLKEFPDLVPKVKDTDNIKPTVIATTLEAFESLSPSEMGHWLTFASSEDHEKVLKEIEELIKKLESENRAENKDRLEALNVAKDLIESQSVLEKTFQTLVKDSKEFSGGERKCFVFRSQSETQVKPEPNSNTPPLEDLDRNVPACESTQKRAFDAISFDKDTSLALQRIGRELDAQLSLDSVEKHKQLVVILFQDQLVLQEFEKAMLRFIDSKESRLDHLLMNNTIQELRLILERLEQFQIYLLARSHTTQDKAEQEKLLKLTKRVTDLIKATESVKETEEATGGAIESKAPSQSSNRKAKESKPSKAADLIFTQE